jgi:hypothetical protein
LYFPAGAQSTMITAAMNEYQKSTCIKFKPYTGAEADYMSIESSATGCWSNLGRIGGMQRLNLQSPGCLYYVSLYIYVLYSRSTMCYKHSIQWQCFLDVYFNSKVAFVFCQCYFFYFFLLLI